MNKYTEYFQKVEIQRSNLENILNAIQEATCIEEKLSLACYASNYAVYNNAGYFTSKIIEKVFTDYAKTINCDLSDIEYKENSFLHILTTGFETGGHTRVVERWIENANENQVHSVIITNPNDCKLETLKRNIKNKNGKFIPFYRNSELEEKAIELRKIASQYQYIILHVHMDDPIPLIAFGTEEFKRPIILYNHASHLFWIGKSIADTVAEIIDNDKVTTQYRNIKNTYFLGVPSKNITLSNDDKTEIREKLGLPKDKKIIITAGGESKYKPICKDNLLNIIKDLINDDTYLYAIGITKNNKLWRKANKETNGHIVPLGYINFDSGYLDYIKSADLYIDSFPFAGGTATIDAISVGTPALSLKSTQMQFDYLTKTNAYCSTVEDFINKAKIILNDKKYAKNILVELQESLFKYQSKESWLEKIEILLKNMPQKHTVKDLTNEHDFSSITDLSVVDNFLVNKNFENKKIKKLSKVEINNIKNHGICYKRQGIPFILEIDSYNRNTHKSKVIKILGITISIKKYKK